MPDIHKSPHMMSHEELAGGLRFTAHAMHALQQILARNPVTHDHVIVALHALTQHNAMTQDEAGAAFNALPRNPDQLRATLTHLHGGLSQADHMMRDEHQRR